MRTRSKRRIVSRSPEQTQEIGIQIANELKVPCVLLLRGALGTGWTVRVHGPIALDDDSEPEPDIAVVPGSRRDHLQHPSHPALIVEVADSSLPFDRSEKASLYARAGIEDYWILNLVDRVLEVYRRPILDATAPFNWRYAATEVIGAQSSVTPLVTPGARIPVGALLP